jgi:hypothetical protein
MGLSNASDFKPIVPTTCNTIHKIVEVLQDEEKIFQKSKELPEKPSLIRTKMDLGHMDDSKYCKEGEGAN